MNKKIFLQHSPKYLLITLLSAAVLSGCASDKQCCPKPVAVVALPAAPAVPVAPPVVAPPPAPAAPVVVAPVLSVIRINAGADANITDSDGNVWLADRGFEGGDISPRDADLKIENTKDAALYRSEHWGMSSFSQPLLNGKYVVKLHFAETWEGVSGPGERVFSFNVEGQEFRDFDVWVKAGGGQRAYIETVNVTVIDGKLDITFEPNVDNPEINGVEIMPAN
jgi:hypothetical protein